VLCVNNQAGQDFLVVLNADQVVNHGQVVEVMDRLRRVEGAGWRSPPRTLTFYTETGGLEQRHLSDAAKWIGQGIPTLRF